MNSQANEAAKGAVPDGARRRVAVAALIALYCLAIFFALDFLYSRLFHYPAGSARIPDPVFSHTLRPDFDGYELWGERKYRFITDSLGFKDAATRQIALTPDGRRVVLIGDSFTEGIGVPFEESFAGMLAAAGARRAAKTEFLDAAVLSYSPSLYYRKIKFLLEGGLRFDEVVVLPDLSDVLDEATSYFCFDESRNTARSARPPARSRQPTAASASKAASPRQIRSPPRRIASPSRTRCARSAAFCSATSPSPTRCA